MSRVRRFTHSLATGYIALGATVVYTLASVPLALHYLSKEEFALWALAAQVGGYLALIDLGMSGTVSRILIDHKDHPETGVYGSIIKTGVLVLVVQGLIITLGGCVLSYWLPDLFSVPAVYRRQFQILVAGQCIAMGASFVGRISTHILQAHQRYDLCNWAGVLSLLVNLAVTWLAFVAGFGIYGLLAGAVASYLVLYLFTCMAAAKLRLFPPASASGHANRKTFLELFSYGRQVFLITVGQQLVSASQVMVISRTLGLTAAATWSIATKGFTVAQQFVNRPYDFSAAGFSEMMARNERPKLFTRFRHLVVLSVSLAVWTGLAVALCNPSFLEIWTSRRVTWGALPNALMGTLVIVNCMTRCYIGFTTLTKDIRLTQYIYLAEGVAFVVLSLLLAPVWGMEGIIVCAVITNLLCTGIYGILQAVTYFQLPNAWVVLRWLRRPLAFFLTYGALCAGFGLVTQQWPPMPRLLASGAFAALAGLALFWSVGLSRDLRSEATSFIRGFVAKVRGTK